MLASPFLFHPEQALQIPFHSIKQSPTDDKSMSSQAIRKRLAMPLSKLSRYTAIGGHAIQSEPKRRATVFGLLSAHCRQRRRSFSRIDNGRKKRAANTTDSVHDRRGTGSA